MSMTGRGGSPSGRGGINQGRNGAGFIRAGLSDDLYLQGHPDEPISEEAETAGRHQARYSYPNGPLIDSGDSGGGGGDSIDASASLPIIRDLQKSGLTPRDMQIRTLGDPEKAACGISSRGEGYSIPYFDLSGLPIPFYRSKILNADYATNGIKYKQPKNTPNHIYFPPSFRQVLQKHVQQTNPHSRILIITEGEKKASSSLKWTGLPTVALGGVENWRSRTLQLPTGTEVYSTQKNEGASGQKRGAGQLVAKLPSSDVSIPELLNLAKGFGDLLDLIQQYDLHPILIYDSDALGTLKSEVQRAATMLAYELVFLGIHSNKIKQVVLPALPLDTAATTEDESTSTSTSTSKCGLDDFLMAYGPDELSQLIEAALQDPKAFPRHPNPKGFISTQLQNNKLSRKAMQQVASMILSELDASGRRFRSKVNQELYYYDSDTHHLLPALKADTNGRLKTPEAFGTLLYQRYGISKMADQKVLEWLASQFLGEEPIGEVQPKRVISLITEGEDPLNPHGVALQASDSQFFSVSPDPLSPIQLLDNGSLGILFEQGHVEPLDVDLVLEHVDHQLEEANERGHLEPWWQDIIDESNIGLEIAQQQQLHQDADADAETPGASAGLGQKSFQYLLTEHGRAMRQYATLLFYISPFLLRWRGLQLPIELTIGSAGSGKSSLYSLRLQILTGRSKLRNIPTDIRDFQSSLANSGGLHVTDNVNFANKDLRQTISDELCRITTERQPEISTRKYYTNIEEIRIPVHSTFAFTALSLPFHNEDLLQRAVTFHTKNVGREPQGDWFEQKLHDRGGREAWFAHHLVFLHLFLKEPFTSEYRTQYRLAHLEQAMHIASKVLNMSFTQSAYGKAPEATSSPIDPPMVSGPLIASGTNPVDVQGPQLHLPPPPPLSVSLAEMIQQSQTHQLIEGDWVMRGITAYVEALRSNNDIHKKIFAADISEFCINHDEFSDNEILINARRLGRYMQERIVQLYQTVGIKPAGSYANRAFYLLTN